MEAPVTKGQPVFQEPSVRSVALPTVAPLFVAVFAASVTLVIGEKYGMGAVPFILVGWCLVLLGSAAWLNQALFSRVTSFLPFLAAVGIILSIWLWQRHAFNVLVPRAQLTYGYFLQPEGANARFWVLSCPFWVGFVCLSVCCLVAVVLGWRAGVRRQLACMIPWWLATFIVFALPSMYLDGQGNASIFI